MSSARVRSLISQLDWNVYCRECDPPVPVDVRARIFYRLRDEDMVRCPNGHRGTLHEYKHAAAHPGEQCGPFVLQQQLDGSPYGTDEIE